MANKQNPAWGRPPLLELNPNNIYGDVPFELPLYTSEAVVAHVLRGELSDNDPKYPLWSDGFEQDLSNQGGLLGLGKDMLPDSNPQDYQEVLKTLRKWGIPKVYPDEFYALDRAVKSGMYDDAADIANSLIPKAIDARRSGLGVSFGPETVRTNISGLGQDDAGDAVRVYRTLVQMGAKDQFGADMIRLDRQIKSGNYDYAMALANSILDKMQNTTMFSMFGLGATKKAIKAPAKTDAPQNVEVNMPQPIKTSTIYGVVGGAALLVIGSVALWAWYKGKKK